MTGETGTAIVLRMLREAYARNREAWTTTRALLLAAGPDGMTVHSRIADARRVLEREGLTIESSIVGKRPNGRAIYAYRIVPLAPVSAVAERVPDTEDTFPMTDEPTLFGSEVGKGPDRWPRD